MKTYTKANKLNTISMLALLWLGSFGVFGQVAQEPDWKWQNPLPTGNTLNDFHFINSLNGWAVGEFGTIVKTTNAGITWQNQKSGLTISITTVHFLDILTGWAVGANGTILKTSNGGDSWQSQSSGTTTHLLSFQFTNAQTGWVVGGGGLILKTSNGGNSWQHQNSETSNNLYFVNFINNENGWAIGAEGTILKTSNGGALWQNQVSGTASWLMASYFLDAFNGYSVGTGGSILKTTNGGNTWQTQSSGTLKDLKSVHFNDTLTGWCVGQNGTILKTINGGVNWQIQNSGTFKLLQSVQFFNAQVGWAIGEFGTALKTINSGLNWQAQNRVASTQILRSVHFADAQNGWAVGGYGTILKTSNGGHSWKAQNSGTTISLSSIHFTDAQTGWAVGGNGIILKTINGGELWQPQSSGITQHFGSVYFINSQTGWVVGNSGTILKTSNSGSNWQVQSSGTPNSLRFVHFYDTQTGWAVGLYGTILKTSNGGQLWQAQNSNTPNYINAIYFANSQIGWAVGEFGLIRKTINGGQLWQDQSSGTIQSLYSVHFIDTQKGWAVGGNGTILKTSNGGFSWQAQFCGTNQWLYSIHFADPQTGWTVGDGGTILTTKTNSFINPETPTSLITGNLFEKTTANCNTSNIPIPNQLVIAMPGPYYGISNSEGKYNLRLPMSDTAIPFSIQALENQNPAFHVEAVCPPSNQYNVLLDTISDTLSNKDFGFEITPCHHLDVQLASNRRRRCFQNTTSISYQNQGSLSAPDAYLLVEFPHWVRPVSASRSHVALNDSVWRFNLDTVSAGESGSFTITDSVICGNLGILGLSQCTKATIFPAPDCPPPPGYNGAEVSVSGKCYDGYVSLGIYNKGNADMADSVDYWVYLDSIQVKQAKVKLAGGDSLKLWVDAQGLSVHLTANQVQNHPTELFVSTTVESCRDTFIFIPRQTVNCFAKQQTPSSKTHCLEIRGAYDPNDKTVIPKGFTNQNIIPPNTQLEYLVRFQNTGNDTAFTVYVIDTLDNNLNPETIELGAASHNYQLNMQTVKSGKTFLRWQFNNIQLPDSNTNKLKSNGFIQYRISPKANLALGSKVKNHAEIYFDFNPPIFTNQTLTTYNVMTFKDSSLNNNVQIVTAAKGKLSPKQIGVISIQIR